MYISVYFNDHCDLYILIGFPADAWNYAPIYPVRKQILSAVVKNYTFAELNKFNKKPEIVKMMRSLK